MTLILAQFPKSHDFWGSAQLQPCLLQYVVNYSGFCAPRPGKRTSRMRLLWLDAVPPLTCVLTMGFLLQPLVSIFQTVSATTQPTLQPLQAVSLSLCLSLNLSAKVWLSTASSCAGWTHVHLRLWSATGWLGPSILVTLCSACTKCILHFPLSLWISLPDPADLPIGNLSSFIAPSWGCRSYLDSFFKKNFVLPSCRVIFLAFWFYEVSCPCSRYSMKIVPHEEVFFIYLWEYVCFMSFYSTILTSPLCQLSWLLY